MIEDQDAIDINRFLSEFRTRLFENKTDKTLIRMIQDNLQSFGPNINGSNLLLNRFMNKEESLFNRIDKDQDGKINKGEMAQFLLQLSKFWTH